MASTTRPKELSIFERFTDVAKRALFFARLEVSKQGGTAILPEHLLLGLARERSGTAASILSPAGLTRDAVRRLVKLESVAPLPTSTEVPFDGSTKRVLFAAESEADQMRSARLLSGHLVLGLLRDDSLPVFPVLHEAGLRLQVVREHVAAAVARGDDERSAPDGEIDLSLLE